MSTTFVWLWTLNTIVFFALGAYFDVKDRIIPDKVWGFQLLIALSIDIWWYLDGPALSLVFVSLANLAFSLLIGVIAFLTGSLSGADVKAIFVLAFSNPITVSLTNNPSNLDPLFPPVIYFLLNVLLIMLFFVAYNILRNLLSIAEFGSLFDDTTGTFNQQVSALVSCWRIGVEELKDLRHMDPAERYQGGEWFLYTPLFQELLDDDEYAEKERQERKNALSSLSQTDREYLWVRPQPPGLVFFLIAYLMQVTIGSPLGFMISFFT